MLAICTNSRPALTRPVRIGPHQPIDAEASDNTRANRSTARGGIVLPDFLPATNLMIRDADTRVWGARRTRLGAVQPEGPTDASLSAVGRIDSRASITTRVESAAHLLATTRRCSQSGLMTESREIGKAQPYPSVEQKCGSNRQISPDIEDDLHDATDLVDVPQCRNGVPECPYRLRHPRSAQST